MITFFKELLYYIQVVWTVDRSFLFPLYNCLRYIFLVITNKKMRQLVLNIDNDLIDKINFQKIFSQAIMMNLKEKNILSNYSWQPHAKAIWYNPLTSWRERSEMIKKL